MEARRPAIAVLLLSLLAAGCGGPPHDAVGTLEYDRVVVPAPVSERIVEVQVREGERVEAGQPLLRLEDRSVAAGAAAARAEASRQGAALEELRAGPRGEQIRQARAQLAAAQSRSADARSHYARLRPLGERQLVAADDVERAAAAAAQARAEVVAARAALDELEAGTRQERIEQGESALRASQAQAEVQAAALDKLGVQAPRAGVVDSLPYELGDQAPVGAPLAILLVGDAPYARVYVPEPIRAGVRVGTTARVHVDGHEEVLQGTVRMIRSEPGFTPYYALAGEDAARLSYLAEIALPAAEAAGLPAGLPVRVEFGE
ncbi:HlyD family secretion protein [Cognatiluteimonas lumbrici]|uniref:HlyD family secretion protein n=1 Tax=Cognatiluteimonas lumbrici TaxID=2559601 RepID=UPI00112EE3F0|nr:HlyD family efflux transporter periplasmic adaptor subunit [Luteimonas lumbrici]